MVRKRIFYKTVSNRNRDLVRYNNSEQDIQNPYYFTEKEMESEPNGEFQAIRLKFNLVKSAYATMCVRELTKSSTSFNFQLKLNSMTTVTPKEAKPEV